MRSGSLGSTLTVLVAGGIIGGFLTYYLTYELFPVANAKHSCEEVVGTSLEDQYGRLLRCPPTVDCEGDDCVVGDAELGRSVTIQDELQMLSIEARQEELRTEIARLDAEIEELHRRVFGKGHPVLEREVERLDLLVTRRAELVALLEKERAKSHKYRVQRDQARAEVKTHKQGHIASSYEAYANWAQLQVCQRGPRKRLRGCRTAVARAFADPPVKRWWSHCAAKNQVPLLRDGDGQFHAPEAYSRGDLTESAFSWSLNQLAGSGGRRVVRMEHPLLRALQQGRALIA